MRLETERKTSIALKGHTSARCLSLLYSNSASKLTKTVTISKAGTNHTS